MLLVVTLFALLEALATSAVRSDRRIRLVHAGLYVVGLVVTHQATLRISKLSLDAMLREPNNLSTLAILVSMELLLTMAVVTYRQAHHTLRAIYLREGLVVAVMSACHRIAVWIPSLLMLPALCYLRSYIIYSIPGVNYWAVTVTIAVILVLLIELIPRIIRDRELLRLLSTLLAGALAVGSVIAYILIPEQVVQCNTALETSSWRELWILLGTLSAGILIGYIAFGFKDRRPFIKR